MALYRRVLVLEVLADRDPSTADVSEVARQITDGDWSGSILADSTVEVDADTMTGLLLGQGSDPSFLVPSSD